MIDTGTVVVDQSVCGVNSTQGRLDQQQVNGYESLYPRDGLL